jgi:GntR family transcriptional regulator
VAHHKIIQKFMPTQDGFTDMAEKAGLESSSIVLRKVIQTAGYQMGKEFSIDPEGELVLLERVRLLDGCPLCIQVSFLPHDLCYGILDYDFTKYSLYQVLREFFHVFMAKSQYNIQAGLAEERELQHLDLEAPSAILWVQHWAFNSSGRLFEFGKSAYRADCFQIKSPINEYEITSEFNA